MSSIVLKKLSKDPRVKAFKQRLENGDFSVDTSSFIAELDRMHATRKVRLLKTKDVIHNAQTKIVSALVQNQAYRSRCVEIKMICFRTQQNLEQHYGSLFDYLKVQYKSDLGVYRTVSERDSAISTLLGDSTYITNQLDVVVQICDLIIADIDQATWSLKNMTDVLKIAVTPETI